MRTTRYNDTGVPTHHIIRSNESRLSTKTTMFTLMQHTCAKDVCMISVHT